MTPRNACAAPNEYLRESPRATGTVFRRFPRYRRLFTACMAGVIRSSIGLPRSRFAEGVDTAGLRATSMVAYVIENYKAKISIM